MCVVGGGPAGISVALRLAGDPSIRVCILESGGLTFEPEVQELARADVVGLPYFPLHETRIRALGGSSWSWGGICTPLDAAAFLPRPGFPGASWPLGPEALEPFLDDAFSLCGVSRERRLRTEKETAAVFAASRLDARRVEAVPVAFSRPIRFGVAHRQRLESEANITVYLHTTMTGLEIEDGRISAVQARRGQRSLRVQARYVVFAGGGVENPRLLLAAGLGGPAVGRFFMEHPRVSNVYRVRRGRTPLGRFVGGGVAGTRRFRRLTIAPEAQRREEILTSHVNLYFGYAGQHGPQWPALRRLSIAMRSPWNESPFFQDAGGGRMRVRWRDFATAARRPDRSLLAIVSGITEHPGLRRYLEIWTTVEQAPEAENRVTLLPEVDRLGVPKAQVHWTVGSAEERTYRRSLSIVLGELERLEPGISGARIDDVDPWPSRLIGTWHHEGTTRMDDDPQLGTVDRDCRVHDVPNLYVAGSSVFPSSGSTSPTITIVQLALRLGDHLHARLRVDREPTPLSNDA